MKKLVILATLFILTLMPFALHWASVQAVGLGDADTVLGITGRQAGTADAPSVEVIIGRGINIALSLMGLIFLILTVYAGYLWMIARGDDEKVAKAKKIIINSLIGLVIVVSAYAITFLVISRFEQ